LVPPYLRLKFERHKRGWSQTDLGMRANISQDDISAIERGRLNPTSAELQRLADAFRIYPPPVLMKSVVVKDPEETATPSNEVHAAAEPARRA
jgi:transcriptional regulator with XRE-family HTH domain